MVVLTPMKLVNRAYLLGHGVPEDVSKLPYHSKDLPGANEVSAYTAYDHSKVFIVDAAQAFVGSANLNDRSMLGTEKSDAEMDMEIVGPSAKDLLDKTIERYTSLEDMGTLGNADGLAKKVHEVAMHNNNQMIEFLGVDFAAGRWTRGPLEGRRLFPGTAPDEGCEVDISHRFTDEKCNITGAHSIVHFFGKANCRCTDGLCYSEEQNACVEKFLATPDDLKLRSKDFSAWIDGSNVVMQATPHPERLQWMGVAAPLTDNL
jgi:hypothetical protein